MIIEIMIWIKCKLNNMTKDVIDITIGLFIMIIVIIVLYRLFRNKI